VDILHNILFIPSSFISWNISCTHDSSIELPR